MTRAHLLRTTAIASGSVPIPEIVDLFHIDPPVVNWIRPDSTFLNDYGLWMRLREIWWPRHSIGKGLDAHA